VTFTPPEQIGKWLRQHRLGNGAFGDAWVFEDSTAKNEYAVIKFLTQSQEPITVTKKRFKKERDMSAIELMTIKKSRQFQLSLR
jgi:hypothetical protein